nr:MAG TPA: hypothetical protein [Caudoviricetes sp.]
METLVDKKMTEHQKVSLLTNHLDLLICTSHQNSSNNNKKEVKKPDFFLFFKIFILSIAFMIF